MLDEEEKIKLVDDLRRAKEEVSVLKKNLNKVNKYKEEWFSKKAEMGNQIKAKIFNVKDMKIKRNRLTNEVKEKKKERNSLNTKISNNIKSIVDKKQEVRHERGPKQETPGKIKRDIKTMEYKLETEPMKFKAEQSIMKKLKSLKKKLLAFGNISTSGDSLRKISKDTDKLKKKANTIHKELQHKAHESQELHERIINISEEIDKLKKNEEEAYEKFFEEKKKFSVLNNELKEKLKSLQELKKKLEKNQIELAEEKTKKDKMTLREKTKEVEEKISKKKKLTTEDLLVMQRKG